MKIMKRLKNPSRYFYHKRLIMKSVNLWLSSSAVWVCLSCKQTCLFLQVWITKITNPTLILDRSKTLTEIILWNGLPTFSLTSSWRLSLWVGTALSHTEELACVKIYGMFSISVVLNLQPFSVVFFQLG